MEISKKIQKKIEMLENFLRISEHFLQEPVLSVEALHALESGREKWIQKLRIVDHQLKKILGNLNKSSFTQEEITLLQRLRESESSLLTRIEANEQRIQTYIEEEKARVLLELTQTTRSQSQLDRFRSQWLTESGTRLDGHL